MLGTAALLAEVKILANTGQFNLLDALHYKNLRLAKPLKQLIEGVVFSLIIVLGLSQFRPSGCGN